MMRAVRPMKPFLATSMRRAVVPCASSLSGRKWKSTPSLAAEASDNGAATAPKLVEIPRLPLLGSLVYQYSGIPKMEPSSSLSFWPELRRRFGDFYAIGIPGLSRALDGTVYILHDPNEFMRVLRSEGKYPTSVVQAMFPFQHTFAVTGNTAGVGILSQGEEWKRIRSFLQTDLLAPQSAARYIPGVIRAAEHISRGAPSRADDLNDFLNEASFDMFSTILLGDMPCITDPTTGSNPEDILFCQSVAASLRSNNKLTRLPYELIMWKVFGIKTKEHNVFQENWDTATRIASRKIEELLEKRDKKELSEMEESSYLIQAMNRQASDKSVTEKEVKEISRFLLTASVDTTSAKLSWHMLHLALNEFAQERVYEEISKTLDDDNKLTPVSALSPYLNACLRESHRMTSPASLGAWRTIPNELTVHNVTLPAGSTVAFDGYSQGMDPDLVEDPDEFRPERWLPDAVEARKGTRSQILDHPLFSGPFSQGARRCPGSRVARNEALVLMAQLILDWKISCPSVESWKDVPYDLETAITCKLPKLNFVPR